MPSISLHRRLCFHAAFAAALGPGLAAPAPAAARAVRWPAAQATPELSLEDVQGRAWKLSEEKGKVVIVNFWATWCEPCRAEMPTLEAMAELYGSDVRVLAVNYKERDTRVTQFARSAGVGLPLLMDRDGAAAARWGVKIFPSTIVVGRDGRARLRVTGEVDWTGREAAGWIEPLLK